SARRSAAGLVEPDHGLVVGEVGQRPESFAALLAGVEEAEVEEVGAEALLVGHQASWLGHGAGSLAPGVALVPGRELDQGGPGLGLVETDGPELEGADRHVRRPG